MNAVALAEKMKHGGLEAVARIMPRSWLQRLVARSTNDLGVALCAHRIGHGDADRILLLDSFLPAEKLDQLIDAFALVPSRLTITFDDGYEDARQYVEDRAPRHPDVTFLMMLCPEKTVGRRGFAWDQWMVESRGNDPEEFVDTWRDELEAGLRDGRSVAGLADEEPYALATAEACRDLAELPNVELGNHTDRHVAPAWLSKEEFVAELRESSERFSDAFGEPRHLALPFGCEPYVSSEDLETAVQVTGGDVWTIENSPFSPDDAVKPRFGWAYDGLSAPAMALYIALQCRRSRSSRPAR